MNSLYTRKLLPLIILILLVACSSKRDLLPEEFFGFKLKSKLTGVEAKKFIDRLHFNEVTPEKNEIGFYESPAGKIIIYITFYDDDVKSFSEFEKMINKISPDNSVFYDTSIFKINQKDIYRCYGMGQVHYVFTSGKELFWVSVDPQFGEKFISEYLNHIK